MTSQNWSEIFNKYKKQDIVSGKVIRKKEGGIIVDVLGAEGFLPWTQVPDELKKKEDIRDSDINVKLLKLNLKFDNIVLSRIDLLEQEKQDTYENIKVGDIYDGVVKSIQPYGVFVTINGNIDGLIHKGNLAHEYVSDANQYVRVGDPIKVKVISKKVDENGKYRIEFSHKEFISSPWERIRTKDYPHNSKVNVEVRKITEKGLVVRLKEGCLGLLPLTSEEKSKYSIGDELNVKMKKMDKEKKQFYVSLK